MRQASAAASPLNRDRSNFPSIRLGIEGGRRRRLNDPEVARDRQLSRRRLHSDCQRPELAAKASPRASATSCGARGRSAPNRRYGSLLPGAQSGLADGGFGSTAAESAAPKRSFPRQAEARIVQIRSSAVTASAFRRAKRSGD